MEKAEKLGLEPIKSQHMTENTFGEKNTAKASTSRMKAGSMRVLSLTIKSQVQMEPLPTKITKNIRAILLKGKNMVLEFTHGLIAQHFKDGMSMT